MLADGGANATPLLDGEPVDVSIASNVISWKMPNSFRSLWFATGSISHLILFLSDCYCPGTAKFVCHANYDMFLWTVPKRLIASFLPRAVMRLVSPATAFGGLGNYRSRDLWRSAKENREMAANITAEWNAQGIDVVIGPGTAHIN